VDPGNGQDTAVSNHRVLRSEMTSCLLNPTAVHLDITFVISTLPVKYSQGGYFHLRTTRRKKYVEK
jgi:hypothetical protein